MKHAAVLSIGTEKKSLNDKWKSKCKTWNIGDEHSFANCKIDLKRRWNQEKMQEINIIDIYSSFKWNFNI